MTLYELWTIVGIPVIRGLAGWAQISFEDGKIVALEVKKLFETILRLGVPALALFYGFNFPVEMAVAFPLIADYIYAYIKKLRTPVPGTAKKK